MSAKSVRRGLWLGLLAGVLFAATAHAETVTVNLDQAVVMKLPDKVATIVIGNPLIADATLQSGGMLVVTGKGYGGTNLVALDRDGRVLVDKYVQVLGPSGDNLIVVYKGVERESYSCAPECERRITLGDSTPYFTSTLTQTTQRNGGAQTAR
jgi:hypothetical protein